MINKYRKEDLYEFENGWLLTSKPERLGNILAHYELYKQTIGVFGDIVECGVFKGSSLIQWATFRELMENNNARKIIGFDIFGPFPKEGLEAVESDNGMVNEWNKQFEGAFISKEDLESSLSWKGIQNVELIQGDIQKTLPAYVGGEIAQSRGIKQPREGRELRISLLHVDVDVYEPTKLVLELLYDRVVLGGMIILDDYGMVEGATLAIDHFFADKNQEIKKLSLSHKPAYIIKR